MKNYKVITDDFITKYVEILDRYIVRPDFTSCWIWFGQRDKYGYGIVNTTEGHFFAHRLMYQRIKKNLDADSIIRHNCDNSSCCNPEHLVPGTQADNMQDKIQRGRTAKGSRIKGAVLNEEQVREIKEQFKLYRGVYSELGRKYSVDSETIRYVITGRNWGHLKVDNPELLKAKRS